MLVTMPAASRAIRLLVDEGSLDPGRCVLPEFPHPSAANGPGGVVATMLDESIGMHAFGVLGVEAPTVQLNISYGGPVPTETPIHVRGRGSREGRRVHGTAEVTDDAGTVLARAEAVLVVTGEVAEDIRLKYLDALGR